jgi:hypothetical protein
MDRLGKEIIPRLEKGVFQLVSGRDLLIHQNFRWPWALGVLLAGKAS